MSKSRKLSRKSRSQVSTSKVSRHEEEVRVTSDMTLREAIAVVLTVIMIGAIAMVCEYLFHLDAHVVYDVCGSAASTPLMKVFCHVFRV